MLIDPKDLAKRTKESARTVSLRIKEKTWVGFEQLAKENQTTANALIGELADYYIESLNGSHSLDLSDSAIAINKFKTFLEKEVRKICRYTIDDIVNGLYIKDKNFGDISSYLDYKDLVTKQHEGTDYDDTFRYASGFVADLYDDSRDEQFLLYPTLKKKANFIARPYDNVSDLGSVVFVPIEKAPDIISLFKAIERYCDKNTFFVNYDGDLMEKITIVVNKCNYELVEKIDDETGLPCIGYEETARRAMLEEVSHLILNAVMNSMR